jgi:hypothetical protein
VVVVDVDVDVDVVVGVEDPNPQPASSSPPMRTSDARELSLIVDPFEVRNLATSSSYQLMALVRCHPTKTAGYWSRLGPDPQ